MSRVSIITPCLNQERYLNDAIQSVLLHTCDELEYLVVDGASTDGTHDILRRYENDLRWISEPDRSQAEAFNKGLQATTHEIVGWLNADDAYSSDAIWQASDFLDRNPEVDVVYGAIEQIDDQGQLLQTVNPAEWTLDGLKRDCFIHVPSVFFRRRVIDRCGPLNAGLKYWADFDFWQRLALQGMTFASLPTLTGRRRIHPNGLRMGGRCHERRAAAAAEFNQIVATAQGRIGSRRILHFAHAKAMAEGYSRENGSGFDGAVMKHALAGHRKWNSSSTQASYQLGVATLALRHVGKELDNVVRHPHCGFRFLPAFMRQFIQTHLRRKIFKLKIHEPRPIALPSYYLKACPLDKPPLISVVTPNLNQGDYLEATIKSVVEQNYPRLEYIVQDGGSTDNSVDIIRHYEKDLARWDSSPDNGQAHAINRGMQHTTGEIMAFLNSDDVLIPGSFSYVADYLSRHPDVDVVYGHRILLDEQGSEIGRWVLPPHDDRLLPWVDYIPQETMFWRRTAWEKVGCGLDESFHFALDWDLILRFQEAGLKFVRLPRFLGAFRVTEVQKTSTLAETVGMREMARLRTRVLGREPSKREIRRVMRPYLWRHFLCDKMYTLGVAKY